MLLDYMRKHTKQFLYIIVPLIVVSFILWGTIPNPGARSEQTLMEIGGRKVQYQEFLNYYRNLREVTRDNFGGTISPEIEKMLNLKQQALERLIQEIVLEQEVERLGIVVSAEEVQDSLKRAPLFQTDGKFDPVKWNSAISNPRNNWAAVAEEERWSLRIQKLSDAISSGARVTEEEIEDEYRRRNEKAQIEFVALKVGESGDEIELSQDETTSYYEKHKQEYVEPAKVKLAYVELKKEPSKADHTAAKKHGLRILERVRAGDDFAELAEFYSDDKATGANGGDLGFFARGRMEKEVEEAAFSMAPGDVSEIVRSGLGYHIIKVEEIKGEGDAKQVRARQILVKIEPSDDTLVSLEEKSLILVRAAADSSLEQAANKNEMSLSITELFSETGGVIPGVGPVSEIIEILPGLEQGKPSSVIEASAAFYIVEVVERKPERIPELSEIDDKIREAASAEKAIELVRARVEEIVAEINEKGAALSGIEGLPKPVAPPPFTRRGYAPELPFISGLVDVVFALDKGKAAGPFVSGDTAYVFVLSGKIPADPEGYETAKDSIKDTILSQRRRQLFQDYFEDLRAKAGVKINQELFQAV